MSDSIRTGTAHGLLSTLYAWTVARIAVLVGLDESIRDAFRRLRFQVAGNTMRTACL